MIEAQDEMTVKEEEEMEMDDSKNTIQSLQSYTDTFFSSGSFQRLEKTQVHIRHIYIKI